MKSGTVDPELVEPLLDLLEDGVVIHDEARRISFVNKAVETITGRARAEIIGNDCHATFPPSGLCGARCAFRHGPSKEASTRRELLVNFVRSDGEQRRIKVRSTPIVLHREKRGVLALVRDVTELEDLSWQLEKRKRFHGMIGSCPQVTKVFETIRAVGASEYPVLITGESGTGKELAARAIHEESRRRGGPFVPINCGALPEAILESELFGHVRGAFTGAIRDKKGRFELAAGGTLFLDEVGELPLHMQVKLLRVLQEKSLERVGGETSIPLDIRVVAATNRDLRAMVSDGTFREDLYYRLCVVPVELPPLRAREGDVPILVEHVLETIVEESKKEIRHIDAAAMARLRGYHWPGNIRELINVLQYASVHCQGDTIEVAHLPKELDGAGPPATRPRPTEAAPNKRLTAERVAAALAETGGNKVQAARRLGVGRATLYRFLAKHRGT